MQLLQRQLAGTNQMLRCVDKQFELIPADGCWKWLHSIFWPKQTARHDRL